MQKTSTVPVITLKGRPVERGQQLGKQAGPRIRNGISFYLDLWKRRSGMDRDAVLSRAKDFIPVIGAYSPNTLDEMEGITLGAGVSLEEVIALNARYEFVWAELEEALKAVPAECTAFAACPQRVTSGHAIIGQNWDYKVAVKENCVITEIIQDDRPNLVIHTEAGILGQKGMNSAGLGLCVNALISHHDSFRPRVPFWVMAREVLNSTTIEEARSAVERAERAVSGNMLIADDKGRAIDLEVTPVDVEAIEPANGTLSHANSFQVLNVQRNVTDKWHTIRPEMKLRSDRARELAWNGKSPWDVETFKTYLRDHTNREAPICAHPNPTDPEDTRSQTLVSMVMDLTKREIRIAEGPPCQNEFETYTFHSLKC